MSKLKHDNLIAQFDDCDVFPVVDRYPADLITPLGAYLTISEDSTESFLFESVERGEALARYSFLGANPRKTIRDDGKGTCFDQLKSELESKTFASVEDLPAFCGGAVGYFDFAAIEQFEPILKSAASRYKHADSSFFMFFDNLIAFDHAKQEMLVISLVFKNKDTKPTQFGKLLSDAGERNHEISRILTDGAQSIKAVVPHTSVGEVRSNWSKTDFLNAVETIKDRIGAGDVYQVVLSQCFSRDTTANAVAIYRALRSLNPSPYMFLIKTAQNSIIGASPEMLIKCTGRALQYRPIAGTRPRGRGPAEDDLFAVEMREDKKEIAEHTMLVDLGRNDLGRVAEYGTVKVNGLMTVEKFSHVQHLVTYLSANLAPDKTRFDALAACFPAGTVSGAPKIRAIETIYELEPTPRGIYAGAVGYIDYAGNLDACIAIRTMVLENGVAKVQAGAGIVADSVAQKEFEETQHKAAGLLRAIDLAESGVYG